MEKQIKINMFIGTPAYGSQIHTDYLHSIISYYEGRIPFSVMTLGNESLVSRGRNTIISYFSTTMNYTHLFFLDADMYLHANELVKLLAHERDVIGAPVALKGYDSNKQLVFNTGKVLEECEDGLLKVDRVGTAVFILSRKAVDALIEYAKENNDTYYSNPNSRGDAIPNLKMYDVFKTGTINGEYLSEDYWVCNTLRELGFDVYVDPTVRTKHNGNYVFE